MDTRSRSPTAKWLDPNRWAPHRFKTDMCKFHQEGKCKRGDACKYAHAASELHGVGGKLRGEKRREYELGERNPSSKPRASSAAASSGGGLVSAPDADSVNSVEGTIVGDAVCIGKASNFGPTIWIGSNDDADDAFFLDKYKITVVVRCKDGYPWSTVRTSRPIVGKRILLGQHPGRVPLRRAERYRERGLVQLGVGKHVLADRWPCWQG